MLKENCFDYAFTEGEQKKVSLLGFRNLFLGENEIILLIDALDELDVSVKEEFLEELGKFYDIYNRSGKIHLIFSSRNSLESSFISKHIPNKLIKSFELRGIDEHDIENLYESMTEKYVPIERDDVPTISKETFMENLKTIQDDIKRNPLLISNLIFIYLTTKRVLDKKFDIIDETVSIMIRDIEQERSIEFKYLDYIKHDRLYEFLGYLALNDAYGNSETLEDLIKDFFKEEIEKKQDDIEEVSNEICKFLRRRSIIVENHIAHSIFSYFLAAKYIFNEIYIKEKTMTNKKYLAFKNNETNLLEAYIRDGFKKTEESWVNISSDFLVKIDNEIHNLNSDEMNECHTSYNTFDLTLKTIRTGFSESAIQVIKELVNENLFYYSAFIKTYID